MPRPGRRTSSATALPPGSVQAGDDVGLLLRGIGRGEVQRGQVVVGPRAAFEAY